MNLSAGRGPGLQVSGERPLSMNALSFPYSDLDRKPVGTAHSSDIRPHGRVTLLVDQRQIGGDDSWSKWGQPHAEFRIPVEPTTFRMRLSPTPASAAGEQTPAKGSR